MRKMPIYLLLAVLATFSLGIQANSSAGIVTSTSTIPRTSAPPTSTTIPRTSALPKIVKMSQNILQKLRSEKFNIDTEAKLRNHPLIADVKSGHLPFETIQRFVYEQYYVALSDQQSGKDAFEKFKNIEAYAPFFHFLTDEMDLAVELHSKLAKALGLNDLESYNPRPSCQAYPAQFSRLASHNQPAVLAAAVAVNFPVWKDMCELLHEALLEHYQNDVQEEDLEFIKMMATPVNYLDKMATDVIEANEGVDYKTIKDGVRILQAFELMFWDGVYQS